MNRTDVSEILERISDGFIALDTEWRFRFVNAAAARFVGRSREELVGRAIWDVFPGLAGTQAEAELRRAADTLEARQVELRGPIFKRMIELRVYPSPEGITAYFLDISERHDAETALRESEAKYRALFEHSLDGFALATPEGVILEMNPAGCAMLQRTHDEIVRVGRPDVLDESDPALAPLLEVRRREGHARGEVTMLRGDGTRLPVELSSALFTDARGEVRSSMTFRDLREQRRALTTIELLARTAAVVQGSLSLTDVLGALAAVVVPALADLVVVDVVDTERIVRIVARDRPGDAPAIDILRANPPTKRTVRGVAKVLHTGEPEVVTTVTDEWLRQAAQSEAHLAAARTLAPVSLLMVPLIARGHTVGVMSLTSLRADLRFTDSDLPLARGVADRAALAIDNARLYEEAVAARVRRDEMFQIVSHDLRGPLNGLALTSTLLARKHPSPEVDTIRRLVAQADRLVKDLVDITQIESGPLQLDRRSCQIRDLLEEAVELHRTVAADRDVALTLEIDDSVESAALDAHRILQALSNLIGNALKFTPSEGRITVRARRDGSTLVLEVCDTGVGIAAEELPYVFDRFWVGRQGQRHGLGLGLAIARGVVEAHGGTITLRSVVGEGTTFEMRLPG